MLTENNSILLGMLLESIQYYYHHPHFDELLSEISIYYPFKLTHRQLVKY